MIYDNSRIQKTDIRKTDIQKTDRRYLSASFTVEAAFIIPILLLLTAGSINLGFRFFKEAKADCEIHEQLKKLDPVGIVRNRTFINENIS